MIKLKLIEQSIVSFTRRFSGNEQARTIPEQDLLVHQPRTTIEENDNSPPPTI
jgi:hypothetical protein